MLRRFALPAFALIATTGLPAFAQQYTPMSYDQQLSLAVNEMLGFYGGHCQSSGNPLACSKANEIQQTVNYMVGADQACLQGDQGACQAYMQSYAWMDGEYGFYAQNMGNASSMTGGVIPNYGGGIVSPTPLLPGELYPGEFAGDARHQDALDAIRN